MKTFGIYNHSAIYKELIQSEFSDVDIKVEKIDSVEDIGSLRAFDYLLLHD